jgi:hypothetical protein
MARRCKPPAWGPRRFGPGSLVISMGLTPFLLPACGTDKEKRRIEPTFIEVNIEGDLGTEEAPLPFSGEPVSWPVSVATFDVHRDPYPFEGDLTAHVRPGQLSGDPHIAITGGEWTGTLTFEAGFGPTRLWMSDEGDKDVDTGRSPSFATGVTEAIHYAFPTIAEVQVTDDPETNQIAGEWGEFRVSDREVVVTVVGTDGFWVTDLLDGPAAYGSLFIYTFGKPHNVVVGSHIASLSGGMQEYLATTQINFPTYTVVPDATLTPPAPAVLDAAALCANSEVDPLLAEAFESSLVELQGATIPDSVGVNGDDYADFLEFGQWPVTADNGCVFYVESSSTVDFSPPDHTGATVNHVRGVLTEVWNKWVIQVRDLDDLDVVGASASARQAAPPARPASPSRLQPRSPLGSP